MDLGDGLTSGQRLRMNLNAREKSLRVVAGLAGISKSRLSQIERGEVALDSRSETVALANALGISPSVDQAASSGTMRRRHRRRH